MPRSVAKTGSNLPNGNFIPEVWSKKLQAKFYASTCLNEITNHDWEGEISGKGSKVHIRKRPTINISDYTVDGDINYQNLGDDMLELVVDKAKYYAFKVDDVDNAQSDIKIVNESTQDASNNMKIEVEKDVFSTAYASASSALASTVVSKTTVLDWIVDAGTALDEKNVPEEGRWLLLPPWICGMIKKSDLKDASIAGDGTSILRNGRVGMIDRFMIYNNNNLAVTSGTSNCMAGTKHAISFASQFVKTETLRLQNQFGDAIRGLKVYGFEETQPDALVHMPATKV